MMAENALEIGEYGEKERVRLVNTVPSAMAELVGMKKVGEGIADGEPGWGGVGIRAGGRAV